MKSIMRWLWNTLVIWAWLSLWACAAQDAKWYIKWSIDDVLRWKSSDALTIIRQPECPQTAFDYNDKDWKQVIVIQDNCLTKSQWS